MNLLEQINEELKKAYEKYYKHENYFQVIDKTAKIVFNNFNEIIYDSKYGNIKKNTIELYKYIVFLIICSNLKDSLNIYEIKNLLNSEELKEIINNNMNSNNEELQKMAALINNEKLDITIRMLNKTLYYFINDSIDRMFETKRKDVSQQDNKEIKSIVKKINDKIKEIDRTKKI